MIMNITKLEFKDLENGYSGLLKFWRNWGLTINIFRCTPGCLYNFMPLKNSLWWIMPCIVWSPFQQSTGSRTYPPHKLLFWLNKSLIGTYFLKIFILNATSTLHPSNSTTFRIPGVSSIRVKSENSYESYFLFSSII